MQHHPIFQGIETDNKIRLQHRPICQFFVEARNLPVKLIHHLHFTTAQNLVPIRNTPRRPPLKQMTSPRHLRSLDHTSILPWSRTYEEYQSSSFRNSRHDSTSAPQVCGCDVERDDVDALPYAEDVAGVHGIPMGGFVPEVGLGGEQELEGYV